MNALLAAFADMLLLMHWLLLLLLLWLLPLPLHHALHMSLQSSPLLLLLLAATCRCSSFRALLFSSQP
jgi:hypothetical protein